MDKGELQLVWLQSWYSREFGTGGQFTANPAVQIETLDPGWAVTISLTGTAMEQVEFPEVEFQRSAGDWVHCWVDGGVAGHDLEWQGRGGDQNLMELLDRFREWVETRSP